MEDIKADENELKNALVTIAQGKKVKVTKRALAEAMLQRARERHQLRNEQLQREEESRMEKLSEMLLPVLVANPALFQISAYAAADADLDGEVLITAVVLANNLLSPEIKKLLREHAKAQQHGTPYFNISEAKRRISEALGSANATAQQLCKDPLIVKGMDDILDNAHL